LAHPIAKLPLLKIRGAEVAAYRDHLKNKGNAPATVVRHLAILSNLFGIARREWAIDVANPVLLVKKPTIRNARTRRLAPGELEKITSATGSIELQTLLQLAVETCMRRSELVQLRWAEIDFRRRIAELRDTKNGQPRCVPMSSRAVELLQGLPRRIDGKVFGLAPDSVTQAFTRACKRAGVIGLRWHDLRREGISRLFEKGWAIPEVACVSGHRTWSQLARYTAINPEDLARKLA
jgi:integrase